MRKFWHKKENIELLKTKVAQSTSIPDVLLHLGLRKAGGNYKNIKYHIDKNNIDISHFNSKLNSLKNIEVYNNKRQYSIDLVLCENSKVSRNYLKKILHKYKFLNYICSECEQVPNWNNKPLVLQIDHINGIYNDNRLSNLRWLCPNCHSQTNTFAGKNNNDRQSTL